MFGIWKIGIPKDALIRLIENMDEDQDGYLTIGEVRNVLKRYGKDVRSSCKFVKRERSL